MKNKIYSNNQYLFLAGFVFIAVMRVIDPNQLISDKEFANYQNSGGSYNMLYADGFFSGIFTIIYSFIFGWWSSVNLTKLKLFWYSVLEVAVAMIVISIFYKSIIDINYPTVITLIITFSIQLIYLYLVAILGSYTKDILMDHRYQFFGLLLTGSLCIAGLIFSAISVLSVLPSKVELSVFSINQYCFFVANISILVIFVMQTAKLIFEKKDAVEKKHLKSVMSLIIIVLAVLVNLSVYQNL